MCSFKLKLTDQIKNGELSDQICAIIPNIKGNVRVIIFDFNLISQYSNE